jgi:hypothetical protein
MGHTIPSQRQLVEEIIDVLDKYKDSLRPEERDIIDDFVEDAYQHMGSVSYGNTYHTWALVIISIMLEREKQRRSQA